MHERGKAGLVGGRPHIAGDPNIGDPDVGSFAGRQ